MARRGFSLLTHALALAVGAALGWFVISGGEAERVRTLERDLVEARRDAGDWQSVAASERERRELAEEDAGRLRQALANPTPPPVIDDDLTVPEDQPIKPSAWSMAKLRNELQRLALAGRTMPRVPLFAAVLEATRSNGEEGLQLILDILSEPGLSHGLHTAAVLVAEELADERAVAPLLTRLATATDFQDQRMTLRALATLPGRAQVPTLLSTWRRDTADPRLRNIAIHGLARRGHEAGIEVVRGDSEIATAPLRARAIESLHSFARAGDYEQVGLIETFGTALSTADGDGQRRLALLALEGYWHVDCLPHLRAFGAADAVAEELTTRALRTAGAIERGEDRPADAGIPREPVSRRRGE